jgi:hypothetical protein
VAFDIVAIQNALAAQITTFTGMRTMAQARDQISPPVAVLLPGNPAATFGITMDGCVNFNVTILVAISDAQPSEKVQRALYAYLGIGSGEVQSIPNAIMSDPSLGGQVHFLEPITVSNVGRIEYAGEIFFGGRVNVSGGTL